MDWFRRDLKFGFRTILNDRAFFVTAVLALALGIGSTTAIFSVIDNVLIEPFPYTGSDRFVTIEIHDSSSSQLYGREGFQPAEFLDYQRQNDVFDRSIGVDQSRVLWTGAGAPESFTGALVTGNTFEFLGIGPLLGRYATAADAKPGAAPVFVLSYKVWQKRFGGDPSILGKVFTLDSVPRTLVGVMPKRFAWWGADLWIPFTVDPAQSDQSSEFIFMLGHLKPGVTPKSAAASLTILARRLSKVYPKLYPKLFDIRVPTLVDNVVGKFRDTLYTMLAAVGLLLLIACANVANLLLAKATVREKEFAIRSSLGAGRLRVIRQLFAESLLLGLMGAAVGCLLAWGGLRALIAALPQFTFPDEAAISLNGRVLAGTLLVAFATSLLFGMAPALGSFSRDFAEALKAGGRGNTGSRRYLRNVLIVSEVALSLVLLTGAGLLMRSFFLQRGADLGFAREKLLVTDINLGKHYKTTDQQARFARDLTTRVSNLPGVVSASAALDFPPFGGINTEFEIAGKTHSEKLEGQMGFVDAQFFRTVGGRLLRGRFLTEQDVLSKRKAVVVNETLVQKYFGGKDPLGKQIKLVRLQQAPEPVANPWFEIVGITSDLKNHGVAEATVPESYAPISVEGFGEYIVFVRAIANPAALAKTLEGEVLALDKSVHLDQTMTLDAALEQNQYAKPRFGLQIFAVFAAIGLILVAVGEYSVVSYTVSQQNREIGIRMALGASTGSVRRWVLLSGMRFIVLGVAIGLAAAFLVVRFLQSQIPGVSAHDPLTLTGVVLLLAIVGLGACYIPSVRATRIDPLVCLRCE